jgi:hypothetical protein
MNKSNLIVSIIFFCLGFFAARLSLSPKVEYSEVYDKDDNQEKTIAVIKKKNKQQISKKDIFNEIESQRSLPERTSQENTKTKEDETTSKSYADYEEMEEEFELELTNFFEIELQIEDRVIEKYKQIKKEYQKESTDYHYSISPAIDNGATTIIIAPEDNIKLANIKLKHLEKLKKVLGNKRYKRYQKFINDFNNNQFKKAGDNVPFYAMEF